MAYVSDSNLTQFWELAKDYINAENSRYASWQKTEKAGAVTCWPVGGTELKPTVDFLFTETGPASGDKGPDNPSTISGVSEVKAGRIGKNLLLKATPTYYPNPSPVTITQNADGTYTLNGTNNTNNIIYVAITDSAYVFSGSKSSVVLNSAKSYTMSGTLISGSYTVGSTSATYLFGYSSNNGYYSSANFPLSGKTSFTLAPKPDADGKFIARMNISPGSTFASAVFAFQLEEGDTATDFEAPMLPADANHDIPLGGTFYGGTVDLATGVMTVTWVAVELNGTETWEAIGSNYNSGTGIGYTRCYPQDLGLKKKAAIDVTLNCACSHFPYDGNFGATSVSDGTVTTPRMYYTNGTDAIHGQARFAVPYSDVSDFKTWLASQKSGGTPVLLTYKIYEPFTVQLSPTQILSLAQPDKYTPRLNTVYTDASAVQVGYAKSPIRSEYELTQAIIATEGGE